MNCAVGSGLELSVYSRGRTPANVRDRMIEVVKGDAGRVVRNSRRKKDYQGWNALLFGSRSWVLRLKCMNAAERMIRAVKP